MDLIGFSDSVHSSHVDGRLYIRSQVPFADWRIDAELLRLVFRSAAGFSTNLGRTDGCSRERRLVRIHLSHRVGNQCTYDPHARCAFLSEARYRGARVAAVSPDYSEYVKFADTWLPAKAGTDSALAMAMTHVVLKGFYIDRQCEYFTSYAKTVHRSSICGQYCTRRTITTSPTGCYVLLTSIMMSITRNGKPFILTRSAAVL